MQEGALVGLGAMQARRVRMLGIFVAVIIALATLNNILNFTPTEAMPLRLPSEAKPFENMDALAASADALKDKIGLVTALSLGLIAAVAFILRDGLGSYPLQFCMNTILSAVFMSAIINSFLSAFDAYNMISVHLREGFLFSTRIDGLISKQAFLLILASVPAAVLLNARLK